MIAAIATTARMGRDALAGGRIIAKNIPYIARQREPMIIGGSTFPISAPARVPVVQPIYGATDRPRKNRELTSFSAKATAKISSVIKKPRSHRFKPLKAGEVFCDRDIDIKAYRRFIVTCEISIAAYCPGIAIVPMAES